MEPRIHTLSNGLRIVHLPVTGKVAHLGLFIRAGTRDERSSEHGIAHFIEHVIFKGTEKRNVFQVLNRLENVGADLNAFTTKEETCIHASFLPEYYERTLELISDITLHSVFKEKELEKEKQVVADEIRSYQDIPSDQIFDDFEDQVYEGHALGKNILGTIPGIKKVNREKVLEFIRNNYTPGKMIISSAGDIAFDKLVRLAEKHFSHVPNNGIAQPRKHFNHYSPSFKEQKKKIFQVHCITGGPGYSYTDPRRMGLALLNNLLGGPVMNSRLSLALRERNGLTYQNESVYVPYSDTGCISIYFSTTGKHFDKAISIVKKELQRLCDEKLKPAQMTVVRNQLAGQIAISRESNLSTMLSMGKSFLMQDRFDSYEVLHSKILETTADDLLEIANDLFHPDHLSTLIFRPFNS